MSTMPPKKGKKRAPPSTPSGRPPAKASRPSSPTESQRSGTPRAATSTLTQSDLHDIPALGSTSGRPGQLAPAAPMEEDHPHDRGPNPPLDDDTTAFATVEDDMDDDEAESSFKELLDWMRYLAQYKGQRGRLTDLLNAAVSSLRSLSGDTGEKKPASYAAAAAMSAPAAKASAKSRPAQMVKQTKRQIQHAVTRSSISLRDQISKPPLP